MNSKIDGIAIKDGYTFWYDVSVVDDHIFQYLCNKFPNGLVVPEFCEIDYFVLQQNLPVEIQSTMLKPSLTPAHSGFEKTIRQQLEQNINNYGKCWFFFDSEYLRYLQTDIEKNISINYDWFYKLMREEKLKVFTVSHDGKIEERNTKEFEFIRKFSSTCVLEENEDERVLQRNKSKIMYNILKGMNIKSEDMVKLRNKLLQIKKENNLKGTFWQFTSFIDDETERSICNIYRMLGGELTTINRALDCKIDECDNDRDKSMVLWYLDVLGITEITWGGKGQNSLRRVVDKSNDFQHFPGYVRNKDKWNYLKDGKMNLTKRQLNAIIRNKINPLDWKKLASAGW
jgi:hypothetical protein